MYAAQLMDKYFKDYPITNKTQNLKNAKNSLFAQIDKKEILDQIVIEDEAIFIENTKGKQKMNALLDKLYENDEEDITEEESIHIP